MTILFSQASIFHLSRLGALYSGKMGEKFSLSNEHERLNLLRLSDASNDLSIRRQYDAFISTLELETLLELQSEGIATSKQTEVQSASLFRLKRYA